MRSKDSLCDLRITMAACEDIEVSGLCEAHQIIKSMCSQGLLSKRQAHKVAVSDLFVEGFLYKPITVDQIHISTDKEYRILKKIKKVRYISEQLVLDCIRENKEDLIRKYEEGLVRITGEYLWDPVFSGNPGLQEFPVQSGVTNVHIGEINRIILQKGGHFSFFLRAEEEEAWNLQLSPGSILKLSRNKFEILEIRKHVFDMPSRAAVALLLSRCFVTEQTDIQKESGSRFRIGYDDRNGQYLKPGSVMDLQDDWEYGIHCLPYGMIIERKNES